MVLVVAVLIAQLVLGAPAAAQNEEPPAPIPSASPGPAVLPPAGIIPANISLDITGAPFADPRFLFVQIRDALDRQIRPTLRPNAGIRYGTFNPWPLVPLASGERTAVNVTVTIVGDLLTSTVTGITTVTLNSTVVPAARPTVLFLSDDPEYLRGEGLIFRGEVGNRPTRLYYYHSNVGSPRNVDVVLTAATPSRVHLVHSHAGPDPDVLAVGHSVSRDYLLNQQSNAGIVVDLVPGKPFIVRHGLMLQGEVVAGTVDMNVLEGGPIVVSVIGAAAGSRPEQYLDGPQQPYDGHNRRGRFNLDGFGALEATYTAGGLDVAVQYGLRTPSPANLDPDDSGRDYGDYGVLHKITFTLVNPTDVPRVVYFYKKPLGGPVRSSFLVDGELKEIGCARLPRRYLVATYLLPPRSTSASIILTMTDGGAYYPLEFGVSEAPPLPKTEPVGSPDGCSPRTLPA
jgi:hypothetical protein